MEKRIDLEETPLIISGRSVGTTRTLSFYKYLYGCLREGKGDCASEKRIAITDQGSGLEKLARETAFRRVSPVLQKSAVL